MFKSGQPCPGERRACACAGDSSRSGPVIRGWERRWERALLRMARTCSSLLMPASPELGKRGLRRSWVRLCIPGGQGVAGSNPAVPTQVKGWFRVSATSFWLPWERTCAPIRGTGQAEWRALPCRHPDQRLLALSASACWFPPFPAASGELPPGQGVAGSDPAVKGWFWATTTAAEGRCRPAATTLSRLVLAALRRRSHRPSDAYCHRRRSVRRSANWWPFSRSCDCHRR